MHPFFLNSDKCPLCSETLSRENNRELFCSKSGDNSRTTHYYWNEHYRKELSIYRIFIKNCVINYSIKMDNFHVVIYGGGCDGDTYSLTIPVFNFVNEEDLNKKMKLYILLS